MDPTSGSEPAPWPSITLYAGTSGRLFKSTDAGANWAAANPGLPTTNFWSFTIDPRTPSNLYALTFDGGRSVRDQRDVGCDRRSYNGGDEMRRAVDS